MAAVVTIATKVVMKVRKCSYKLSVFFCPILRKFEISQQVLVPPPPPEKFVRKSVQWSRVVPRRLRNGQVVVQTDLMS